MLRYVLPMLLIAVLIGWFLPDSVETKVAPVPAATAAPVKKPKVPTNESFDEVDDEIVDENDGIVLQRQSDGHFYADVDVDGKVIRFLVDTGATGIALTGQDADALGIDLNDGEMRPIGNGASGPVYGTNVTLGNVQLGGVEAEDINAAVVPSGLGVSLLGQSFLSKADSVVISKDRMQIK